MKNLEWVNLPYINKSAVAKAVLGDKTHSRSYFQNKMDGQLGKKFSETELKKIEEVRKEIIQKLL